MHKDCNLSGRARCHKGYTHRAEDGSCEIRKLRLNAEAFRHGVSYTAGYRTQCLEGKLCTARKDFVRGQSEAREACKGNPWHCVMEVRHCLAAVMPAGQKSAGQEKDTGKQGRTVETNALQTPQNRDLGRSPRPDKLCSTPSPTEN